MKNYKYTAIITARGGSKGLPKKNILDLHGKPLIAHTIHAAQKSNSFHHIVVSTECDEIKLISSRYGADIIDRPLELAGDHSSSLDVIEHTLNQLKQKKNLTNHFVLLQPTSPLRGSSHIREAIEIFEDTNSNSLASITKSKHPIQKNVYFENSQIKPVFDWNCLTKPRQALQPTYQINGAIYIAKSDLFLKEKNLFIPPLTGYEMSEEHSIDIDSYEDFLHANYLLSPDGKH